MKQYDIESETAKDVAHDINRIKMEMGENK
jgi:hypothetical protein